MMKLDKGISTTFGVGRREKPLTVSAGQSKWHVTMHTEAPLVTIAAHAKASHLPVGFSGDEASSAALGTIQLRAGDVVNVALPPDVAISAMAEKDGDYDVFLRRSVGRDVITKATRHETFEIWFSTKEKPRSRDTKAMTSFFVSSDDLGFALRHPAMAAKLREIAGAEVVPMEFLTTHDEADAFLAAGWVVPVLGVKPLWPYRVLFAPGERQVRLPIGTRVLTGRLMNFAGSDRYLAHGGNALGEAIEPEQMADVKGPFWGAHRLDVYVAGGELATIVFTPDASSRVDAVEPLVNVDLHSLWREVSQEPFARIGLPPESKPSVRKG